MKECTQLKANSTMITRSETERTRQELLELPVPIGDRQHWQRAVKAMPVGDLKEVATMMSKLRAMRTGPLLRPCGWGNNVAKFRATIKITGDEFWVLQSEVRILRAFLTDFVQRCPYTTLASDLTGDFSYSVTYNESQQKMHVKVNAECRARHNFMHLF